jgi:hypothetical protein
MTSEDVTQMDTQLDRTDRLSIQDMNIEQVLNTILNTCSSKALGYDLEVITACNDFMQIKSDNDTQHGKRHEGDLEG